MGPDAQEAGMTNQFAIACAVSLLLSAAVAARTATVPLQHIETARMLLDQIDDKSLKKNARERMVQLRKMFGEMVEAYAASTADWRTKFSAVESELTRIIGGGRGPGLESVRAGAGGETVVPNRAPVEPSVAQPGGIAGGAGGAAVVGDIGVK